MPAGRPRKPTALKILEGNRGKRKLDPKAEPQPTPGVPRMPAGLPSIAQRIWKQIVPELDRLNLLAIVDSTSLEAAVRGASQGIVADRAVDKAQAKIASGKAEQHDYYQLSILMAASRKAWTQWKSFATEFGLTPAARSRLQFSPGGSTSVAESRMDPLERALCG